MKKRREGWVKGGTRNTRRCCETHCGRVLAETYYERMQTNVRDRHFIRRAKSSVDPANDQSTRKLRPRSVFSLYLQLPSLKFSTQALLCDEGGLSLGGTSQSPLPLSSRNHNQNVNTQVTIFRARIRFYVNSSYSSRQSSILILLLYTPGRPEFPTGQRNDILAHRVYLHAAVLGLVMLLRIYLSYSKQTHDRRSKPVFRPLRPTSLLATHPSSRNNERMYLKRSVA